MMGCEETQDPPEALQKDVSEKEAEVVNAADKGKSDVCRQVVVDLTQATHLLTCRLLAPVPACCHLLSASLSERLFQTGI